MMKKIRIPSEELKPNKSTKILSIRQTNFKEQKLIFDLVILIKLYTKYEIYEKYSIKEITLHTINAYISLR